MKRFTYKILLFLMILTIIILGLDYFIITGQREYPIHALIKLKKVFHERAIDADIVIFGSSVSEGAVIPSLVSEDLGMTCYNLSLSGRRITDWGPLAIEYLSYSRNTKVVFLEIFPHAFNRDSTIYHPHDFYPYLSNKYVRSSFSILNNEYKKMAKWPYFYLTHLNTTIISNSFKFWSMRIFNDSLATHLPGKGYYNVQSEFDTVNEPPKQIDIDNRSVHEYENLVAICKEKGVKVYLIGMPVYKPGKPLLKNIDKVYQLGMELASKNKEVVYLDFYSNNSLIEDQTNFANYTHLNDKGAERLTNEITRFIVNDPSIRIE